MSFQVPRRQNFPRPLGDNSPYTPPDPEPGPAYKMPNYQDYLMARIRWEDTGDLEALWEMQDNVSLSHPRDIAPEDRPPTPSIVKPKPEPEPIAAGVMSRARRAVIFALLVIALLNFLVATGLVR